MSIEDQSTVHMRVLNSLKGKSVRVSGRKYQFLAENKGGRIDIPREDLASSKKGPGQREKNLMYADAVLIDEDHKPRIFVEIVDSSPKEPNGIAGLVINADRVSQSFYPGLDLAFIVLAEMKQYWCSECQTGHKLSTSRFLSHFDKMWSGLKAATPEDILHEGIPLAYRKALKDYPIAPYLRAIRPPSVLFLNRAKIDDGDSWTAYAASASAIITGHLVRRIQSTERDTLFFDRVDELFPASVETKASGD